MPVNASARPPGTFVRYWLPAILYAVTIFAVSSIHSPIRRPRFPQSDKVLHFAEYAVLAWLWFRALSFGTRLEKRWIAALALSVTAVLGGLDEWYQLLNPSRTSDIMDFAADLLGGMMALTLSVWMRQEKARA